MNRRPLKSRKLLSHVTVLSSRKVCLNSCPLPRTPLNCILGSVSRLQSLDPDARAAAFLAWPGVQPAEGGPRPRHLPFTHFGIPVLGGGLQWKSDSVCQRFMEKVTGKKPQDEKLFFLLTIRKKKIKQNQTQCYYQILSQYLIPPERMSLGMVSVAVNPAQCWRRKEQRPQNRYRLSPWQAAPLL